MSRMKWMMPILILALAVPAAHAYRADRARSLQEVRVIWVDAEVCPTGISKELEQHGFEVTANRRHADSILKVDVSTNGRYADHNSVERARYTARLIGDEGDVLFRTAGTENAHDLNNLCEDVGDDISDRLESVIES